MIIWKLFFVFLKISILAVGGGYSFLPLLERELVDSYHWMSREEFLDVLGLVKIFPGAISIKYATYTGYKLGGLWGILAANLGNIFAPAILIVLAGMLYSKYKHLPSIRGAFSYVQLVVAAMLIALAIKSTDFSQLWSIKGIFIVIIAFIFFMYTKIHPGFIIVGAAIIGAILSV